VVIIKLQFKRTATKGERVVAFFIDHMLLALVFILFIIIALMVDALNSVITFKQNSKVIFNLIFLPGIAMKDFVGGRSIGKRAFNTGVRCVENPNEVPKKWKLFIRNLTLIIWPVDFLVMILNEERMRLGDILAKTVVVKLERANNNMDYLAKEYIVKNESRTQFSKKKIFKICIIAVGIFGLIILLFIGGIGIIMKNNGAYEAAISQIENNNQVVSQIGEIQGYGLMPTGSISIDNGYGQAELFIKVKGDRNSKEVFAKLYKEPENEWKVITLEVID